MFIKLNEISCKPVFFKLFQFYHYACQQLVLARRLSINKLCVKSINFTLVSLIYYWLMIADFLNNFLQNNFFVFLIITLYLNSNIDNPSSSSSILIIKHYTFSLFIFLNFCFSKSTTLQNILDLDTFHIMYEYLSSF